MLGANEVGMLQALLDAGITPDLIVGTSVGAINGAYLAVDPTVHAVEQLAELWAGNVGSVWKASPVQQLRTAAKTGTALHRTDWLRAMMLKELGDIQIEDLAVPFQCCAASIERAAEHWFDSGPIIEAVLASCAVPGLFPAVAIDGEHYLDGGLVNSIPVARAVEMGARTIYVLQVGRIERQLTVPTRPWEVALVAFEIARRHRFARDMATVPDDVVVHLLPSGEDDAPATTIKRRDAAKVPLRIERARERTATYLTENC